MKKNGIFNLFNKIAFVLVIFATVTFVVFSYLAQPGPNYKEVVLEISPGMSASEVTKRAHNIGVVKSEFLLFWALYLNQMTTNIKAGEYIIPPKTSIFEILAILREGDVKKYLVTIAEGLSVVQVLDILNENEHLSGEINFYPKEGSLLPDTYQFTKNYDRNKLLLHMQDQMNKFIDKAWENRKENLPFSSKEEALILASIVEKETGINGERATIAGVFVNRLRRKMRLQSDPTIIYGITFGRPLGRAIKMSEINAYTEYNTYQIDGLPKTPIANPGRDSILATLNPLDTDYIYFVASGDGGHNFASTLDEHNRNVRNWRRKKNSN